MTEIHKNKSHLVTTHVRVSFPGEKQDKQFTQIMLAHTHHVVYTLHKNLAQHN